MILKKKSQAAVEYLQTYGWAILIVILVGIAIWQLGILGRERINIASGFTTIQVVQQSIKYTASGSRENNFAFMVMNAGNMRVTNLYAINASGDCSNILFDYYEFIPTPPNQQQKCEISGGVWIPGSGKCFIANPINLDPGDRYISPKYTNCEPLVKGEQFEVHITFYYEVKVGKDKVIRTESGVVRGYAE